MKRRLADLERRAGVVRSGRVGSGELALRYVSR